MSDADALGSSNLSQWLISSSPSVMVAMMNQSLNHSNLNHLIGQPPTTQWPLSEMMFPKYEEHNQLLDLDSDGMSLSISDNEPIESPTSFFTEHLGNSILVLCYSLIVLVSLFGNCFVCRVMLTMTSARTTTNMLIVNLAVSDLLLTTFNIPVNIVRFVSRDWPFGSVICTLAPFIQSLSAHCSSITMMVIAFERYQRLIGINPTLAVWSFLKRTTLRLFCFASSSGPLTQTSIRNSHISRTSGQNWPSLRMVMLIWLCSALLSIPHGLYNQVVVYPGIFTEMVRCAALYPSETFRLWLSILTPFSQYLLPIGLTALFYARIGYFLWRRTDPVGVVSEGRRLSILRRKRKRVKMLVVVVAVFALCWLPLHLYVTLIDFHIIQHHFGIFFVTHWIAMSSVCYNPFIYCWLNETFRRKTNSLLTVFAPVKNCFQRALSIVSCCCSLSRDQTNKPNTSGNHLNNRSLSNGSANSDEMTKDNTNNGGVPDNSDEFKSTTVGSDGKTMIANGKNSKKCPELAIEMTTCMEISEYDD